jgi:DNA topoisomerase-1
MSRKLLIVESPGKLAKIRELLGKGYLVDASVGHITEVSNLNSDICKFGININTYEPIYQQCENKKQVIQKLIKLCKEVGEENVLLAADEDREGEAIGAAVAEQLGIKNPIRIVFNSITADEINKAIKNPRGIDMNLLYAQRARVVLDKFAGFIISPLLSKSGCIGAKSAGRVQSVVTKIIVDKEKEIIAFFEKDNPTYFNINSDVKIDAGNDNYELLTKLVSSKQLIEITDQEFDPLSDNDSEKKHTKNNKKQTEVAGDDKTYAKIDDEETTTTIIKAMIKSNYEIDDVKVKTRKSNPPPPFSTSTLQQFTSVRLKMNGKYTMEVAQRLYEAGYITYMRTDSTSISAEAITNIKKYVTETHGDNYYFNRIYKSKKNNTQEAHECVRPTKVNVETIKGKAHDKDTNKEKIIKDQEKLYNAIWKRTIQSQMSSAEYNDIIIEIKMKSKKDKKEENKILSKYKLVGTLETLLFEGFLILDGKVPKAKLNSKEFKKAGLQWIEINGIQNCKKPPTRYNDASLINKMDPSNLNIGRPSTYASIIDTIQKREYALIQNVEGKKIEMAKFNVKSTHPKDLSKNIKEMILGQEVKKFVPSKLGIKVTEFLEENFTKLMNYKFTEEMEKDLDKIACGKSKRYDIVDKFYKYLLECVDKLKVDDNKIGQYDGDDILLLNGKWGKFIKYKKTIINLSKLISAHDLKLKNNNLADNYSNSDNNSYNTKDNKKIIKAVINEIDYPKIEKSVASNTESLYDWKIKRTKYLLKKSKNNSYYVEERDQNDKVTFTFSLKFAFNKISKDKELPISDYNINEICSFVTEDDITNAKDFFYNLKKK